MLVFPNAKINLGLNITEKRPDGFHNIETVFFPIAWADALEVIPNEPEGASSKVLNAFEFSGSGLRIGNELSNNLVYKAWSLIKANYQLPNIKVHLHKVLPMGAGLGGGSADAAFFIKLINDQFDLKIPLIEQLEMARKLGSDCAFFIENKPLYATGKGDVFESVNLTLNNFKIMVIYPNIHSNTKIAYGGVVPKKPKLQLKQIIENYPIEDWKNNLFNDFENSIFVKYPRIAEIKQILYEKGAVYASLSGSGSAVYGLFKHEVPGLLLEKNEICWQGTLEKNSAF